MKVKIIIKGLALPLLGSLLLFGVVSASPQRQSKAKARATAQNQSPVESQTSQPPASSQSPDIEIKARATAKELKFEVVGNATVEFTGNVKRDTVSKFDRGNLPDPVKPGVTYKEIEINLLITSMFADIKQIVSEILREKSANQDGPQQKNEPSKTQTSPPTTKKPGGGSQP